MSFCVRSIRIFSNFWGDPYYEPLSWFMIYVCMYVCMYVCIRVRIHVHREIFHDIWHTKNFFAMYIRYCTYFLSSLSQVVHTSIVMV